VERNADELTTMAAGSGARSGAAASEHVASGSARTIGSQKGRAV
jgi:hypothetical protein